jgi:hypothetical protein
MEEEVVVVLVVVEVEWKEEKRLHFDMIWDYFGRDNEMLLGYYKRKSVY